MYDPAPRRGPATPEERWVVAIFALVLFGLFAAAVFYDYRPINLGAMLVVLFWIPLLALHEAGHAMMASLLGWHVGQIVIGMGRIMGTFRIGHAVVEIRLLPVEGFVKCVPRNLHRPQLKSALIYFAGPGIELLLALVILIVVGPATLFTRSDSYLLIVWQSLALAGTAQAVLNLLPHSIRTTEGDVANDGLGIIRSFFRPDAHYAEMIGQSYNHEKNEWEQDDPADWWKRR